MSSTHDRKKIQTKGIKFLFCLKKTPWVIIRAKETFFKVQFLKEYAIFKVHIGIVNRYRIQSGFFQFEHWIEQ
jgi:hypothetical protein